MRNSVQTEALTSVFTRSLTQTDSQTMSLKAMSLTLHSHKNN